MDWYHVNICYNNNFQDEFPLLIEMNIHFNIVLDFRTFLEIRYYVQDAHSFWDWIYFVLLIVVNGLYFYCEWMWAYVWACVCVCSNGQKIWVWESKQMWYDVSYCHSSAMIAVIHFFFVVHFHFACPLWCLIVYLQLWHELNAEQIKAFEMDMDDDAYTTRLSVCLIVKMFWIYCIYIFYCMYNNRYHNR